MDPDTNYFGSETEATTYLNERWSSDGPAEVARIIELGKAELAEQGEDPTLWWDGIPATELVDYLIRLM